MSASSQRLYTTYPTSLYTLDDDQFSLPSPDREMSSARSLSFSLSDVPEEDPASLAASGPYVNNSAANSTSTFHGGGGGAGTSRSRTTTSTGQLQQRTPSIRTLGRSSTDPIPSPPSGTPSSSNVRRAQSSGSTTRTGGSRSSTSASADRTLRKYRSTPRLPHERDVELAPSTAMYWSRAPVWGHLPSRTMRAHSVTLVDTTAWLYGGCDDKDSSKDIYCFDTETMQWTHPDTVGDIPPPCRAHTATLVDKKIIVFGGGLGPVYYDATYVLDTTTRRWTRPTLLPGPHPTARRAHAAVFYKGKVWVFGGGNGLTALNDVWTLEVGPGGNGVVGPTGEKAMRWEEVETSGKKPSARGYHTATLIGNVMVIIGGSDGKECFTDVWFLNLDTLVWSMVKQQSPTHRRLAHSATQVGSYIFIVGGHNSSEYGSDLLLFNLVSLQYEPRTILGKPPSARGYHATILADSRVFLFGGYNGQSAFDDVHVLDLAAGAYLPQVTSFSIEA